MHKLFLAIIFTTGCIQADSLLDAIRNHDLKGVALLLQHKEFNPYNYNQYLAAAAEAIQISREQLLAQEIKPKTDSLYALLSLICLGIGGYSLMTATSSTLKIEYNGSLFIDSAMDNFKSHFYISGGSYITAFILLGIGMRKCTADLKNTYDNALKIQDLIVQL